MSEDQTSYSPNPSKHPSDVEVMHHMVVALDSIRAQAEILTEFVSKLDARLGGISAVAAVVDENEERLEQERQVAIAKDFLSHMYREAHLYSAVIVAGGYAAFFTTLTLLSDRFSDEDLALSAVLMTISLATFVFWEVGNIIWITLKLAAAKPPKLPQPTKLYYAGWISALAVSLGTALPAFAISLNVYLNGLGWGIW